MMDGKKIYSDDEALKILKINRLVSFFIAVGFLFINVYDKKIKKKYKLDNLKNADLQILSSFITLISSLIVLYVAFSNSNEIIKNENPEI